MSVQPHSNVQSSARVTPGLLLRVSWYTIYMKTSAVLSQRWASVTKLVRIGAYYILPLCLLVSSVFFSKGESRFFAQFGEWALWLIMFNLFIKPVALVTKNGIASLLLTLRREVGVASFWLYLFHSMGMVTIYKFQPQDFAGLDNFLLYGALAGMGMWVLGLTSNNIAQRFLKQNWKKVQMVAYPVLFLAMFHGFKAQTEIEKFYLFSVLYLFLKVLQYKKIDLSAQSSKLPMWLQ